MAIPNGETHAQAYPRAEYIGPRRPTRGTETSKYPEEDKSTEIPSVVVSERGGAQTGLVRGCGTAFRRTTGERSGMESPAEAGDSPVATRVVVERYPE